jgi:SAM-dependent methyltransferase
MTQAYSGVDNLEVMRQAANYHNFLIGLVSREAGDCRQLVDFGAGLGTYAESLAELGYSVTCIEKDASLLQALQTGGLEANADISELKAAPKFIYSLNVLEHIQDDKAVIQAMADRLAPGGRLLIYVPAFPILFTSMDRKVGHHRRYRMRQLASLISQAGLTITKSSYIDSLGFFATLLYKLIGNKRGDINPQGLKYYDKFALPISLALDRLTGKLFGKNLLVVATKHE